MSHFDIQVDTHTHSVLSGHAWSTIHENVMQAKAVGLKAICMTEHSGAVPGAAPEWSPVSMHMLPTAEDGIRLVRGLEADIVDLEGTICPRPEYLQMLEFCILSMHAVTPIKSQAADCYTQTYLKAMQSPYVTMIGHADRIAFPCDLEAIVCEAKRRDILIELNNASLTDARAAGHANVMRLAALCRQYQVPVCISSDAHYHSMVGDVRNMQRLLEQVDFPPKLVMNLTLEQFETVLQHQRERTRAALEKQQRLCKFVY